MRFVRSVLVPVAAVFCLGVAACRGHTSPSCGNAIATFSEALPGAGDLTGATISTSDSCDAYVDSTNHVDVGRSAPGSCSVQVALTNGAVYTFAVAFDLGGANEICPAHLGPVDASSPVQLERGRCYALQDGSAGATARDAGADASTDASPACSSLTTGNGVPPMQTCGCAPTDPQLCSAPCGPEERGTMPVTCTGGVYTRAPVCSFDPAGDYACYRFPTAQPNPTCPADNSSIVTPQDSTACAVDHCVVCNSYGGISGGVYLDVRGTTRVGYCVCRLPDAAGRRTWSCADDADWPCLSGC